MLAIQPWTWQWVSYVDDDSNKITITIFNDDDSHPILFPIHFHDHEPT